MVQRHGDLKRRVVHIVWDIKRLLVGGNYRQQRSLLCFALVVVRAQSLDAEVRTAYNDTSLSQLVKIDGGKIHILGL